MQIAVLEEIDELNVGNSFVVLKYPELKELDRKEGDLAGLQQMI